MNLLPWYAGPNWPTNDQVATEWLVFALLAFVGFCVYQAGAWHFGWPTISALAHRTVALRILIGLAMLLAAAGIEMHFAGYQGP